MQEIQVDEQNNRKIYIEAMRIFAILFVIFNHTNTVGFVHLSSMNPLLLCFGLTCFSLFSVKLEHRCFL